MTWGHMSRLSSHACGAFVSFLTNVTTFLTKQFSRLNYRHTPETHSVRPIQEKSLRIRWLLCFVQSSIIFFNLRQMNSSRTYRSEESTCVSRFWDIRYPIESPFDILSSNQICQPQVSILYNIFLHISFFLKENILYKRTNCRYVKDR